MIIAHKKMSVVMLHLVFVAGRLIHFIPLVSPLGLLMDEKSSILRLYFQVPRGSVQLHRRLKYGLISEQFEYDNSAISVKPHSRLKGNTEERLRKFVKIILRIRRDYTPNPAPEQSMVRGRYSPTLPVMGDNRCIIF